MVIMCTLQPARSRLTSFITRGKGWLILLYFSNIKFCIFGSKILVNKSVSLKDTLEVNTSSMQAD